MNTSLKFNLFTIILIIFFFESCKTNETEVEPINIVKDCSLEWNFKSGSREGNILFKLDSLKKITSIIYSLTENSIKNTVNSDIKYNSKGDLISLSSENSKLDFEYFENKIIVNSVLPLVSQLEPKYDLYLKKSEFLLNDKGQIKELAGFLKYEYDIKGNLIKIYKRDKEYFLFRELIYDDKNNPLPNRLIQIGSFTTIQNSTKLYFDFFPNYHGVNNVIKIIEYNSNGSISSTNSITYNYDKNNFPINSVFSGKETSTYIYSCGN